ncbi:MAG TPA: PAS domain S-box protein [Planctomycetaceae bacterium]|nr:PAS domain S-box protein [Planctomycetaceae bacterium]HIQ22689.1 PAS domain S-box protein [Planctomycetota bacterium]
MNEPVSFETSRGPTSREAPTEFPSSGEGAPVPLERQEAMLALGRRAMDPPEEVVFLQESAAMIARLLGVEHSGVAQCTPEGQLLVCLALNSQSGTVVERVGTQSRRSLAAFALEQGEPVIVEDWGREVRLSDPLLQRHGFSVALAVPLKAGQRRFGVLLAGSPRPVTLSDDDVLFAENISYLVTATIARRKTEEALELARSFADRLMQTLGAMVLVLDPKGRILRVNRTCERITGFPAADLEGRVIHEVFPVTNRPELFTTVFRRVASGSSPVEYESALVAKDGTQWYIAWSYSGVNAPDGSLERVIATGIDVTALRQATETGDGGAEAVDAQAASPAGKKPRGGTAETLLRERRHSPRRPYPYLQAIAYVLDGHLPALTDFFQVECHDIAGAGFSFLSSRPPQSDTLVVALGRHPRLTHLSARVIHATRIEHRGKPMFLIGCAYLGRVRY